MRGTGRIDIRFRLFVPNGGMRMIERSAYSYFRNEPDVMRVNDVARLLHCSKNTLYALIHDGRLMCLRLGRNMLIPKTALVEFIMCEKYYQVISPKASDNHWTSRERCDIVCPTNGRNTRKPAKRKEVC